MLTLQVIQPETDLSIFDSPVVDTSYLTQQWQAARDTFLTYVRTRHGLEVENLRFNTEKTYRVALGQFFDGVYDSYGVAIWPRIVQPWAITKYHAEQWRLTMGTMGKAVWSKKEVEGKLRSVEVGRAGISSASIALKLAALKEFFDFVQYRFEIPLQPFLHNPFVMSEPPALFMAESRRHILLWSAGTSNPFDANAVQRPKVTPYGKSVEPTTAEVAAILNQINLETVSGKRDYALLLTIFATACRSSEILHLKWGDLEEGNKGQLTFSFRGKSGRVESVALDREAYEAIVAYLAAADRLGEIGPDDYIFRRLNQDSYRRLPGMKDKELAVNTPLAHETARNILKKYGRLAGVDFKKAHLHGLRHAATIQTMEEMESRQGMVDVMALKQLLRHSNLNTTQIYADKKRKAEDPWASARIASVRPNGVKPRRPKKVAAEQLPLETPEEKITRLEAEIQRLKSGSRE